jgi:hypothetical protein
MTTTTTTKKRAKPYSANNASKKRLEQEGWVVGIVEQTIRGGGITFKRDLFSMADLFCMSPSRGVMFVQATGGGNGPAREKKIRENPLHAVALASNIRIQVHDWRKRTGQKDRVCMILEIQRIT